MDLFYLNVAHASLDSFIYSVNSKILNPIIILLFAVALAVFLYGVMIFILNPESEDSKTKGKQHMLWGIIGFTIMMGAFAILNILMSTFNIQGINVEKGTVDLPEYNP